jgi:hypothetical protein
MFVIDHSGSMTGEGGSQGNDRTGSRYTVTMDLLDTLFKYQPNAEVGIVVFRCYLFFDTSSTEYYNVYFKTLPQVVDSNPDQAYLQLLTLNADYGGRMGIDIIKDVIDTQTVAGSNGTYTDLVYEPTFSTAGSGNGTTNINVAFMGAKDAFKSAKNPPNQQFVIFFSDGEPAGAIQAGLPQNDFQNGANVPTTFTVYFTSRTTAPASLQTMTNNIQTNGYSTSNPQSALWPLQTSHDALLNLLMGDVISSILVSAPPSQLGVNGVFTSTSFVNNSFTFLDRFPLQPDVTTFNLNFSYTLYDSTNNTVNDTQVVANITVQRRPGATVPSGIKTNCWLQPSLDLRYNGQSLLGGVVREYMNPLEVVLTPNGEIITAATVQVSSSLESEYYSLAPVLTQWSGTFNQLIAPAVPSDKILQHQSPDSIIVVWRNPKLPLDTVRIAVPFAKPASIPVIAATFDTDGEGHIDRVDILFPASAKLRDILPAAQQLVSTFQFTTLSGAVAVLQPAALSYSGGTVLSVMITQNKGPLETGWSNPNFLLTEIPMTSDSIPFVITQVIDRAGPVIEQTYNTPGDSADTLLIIFSEPVNWTSNTPTVDQLVNYYHDGKPVVFPPETQVIPIPGTDSVRIIIPQERYNPFPYSDSLRLLTTAPITDTTVNHNIPGSNTDQVVIAPGILMHITAMSYPNPFVPGVTLIPPSKRSGNDPVSGTRIEATMTKSVTVVKNPSVTLLDAIGNVVRYKIPMKGEGKKIYIIWDGRNERGKYVASGTYLARIELLDKTTNWIEKKETKIGVKR